MGRDALRESGLQFRSALNHVRERKKTEIAFFVSLEQATPAMVKDAASVSSIVAGNFTGTQVVTEAALNAAANANVQHDAVRPE